MGPQGGGAQGGGYEPGGMTMAEGGGMGEAAIMMVVVLVLAVVGAGFLVLLLRRAVVGNPEGTIRAEALRRLSAQGWTATGTGGNTGPSGEIDAFLVIPDISGYTQFMQLNRFSLAHAQYTVSALLGSIIDAAEDCLATAKVEGDAVFLYALRGPGDGRGGVAGEHIGRVVVEILRGFYVKRAELQATNTCPCEACRNVDKLELKTVVHSGKLWLYNLRGQQELSGLPVIVAHRLLKNSLGLTRYVMVTEAAHADTPIPLDIETTRHSERYEGVGEIAAYVYAFGPEALALDEARPKPTGLGAKAATAAQKLRENLRGLKHRPPEAAP